MNSPMEYIPDFTKALTQIAETIQPDDTGDRVLYIGLKGSFGDHHVNPRTLRAKHLGKLVCLEGIVTRCKSLPYSTLAWEFIALLLVPWTRVLTRTPS